MHILNYLQQQISAQVVCVWFPLAPQQYFVSQLSLWFYCWLVRTSHRLISRSIWLKVPCKSIMLCAILVDSACAYFESWGSSVAWRWFLRMWPMSWWRWTCSERGACSFNLPRPSSLWAEETLFLSVFTFFWGLFSSPTLFAATGQQPTCSW